MAEETKALAAPLSGKASFIVGTVSGLLLVAAAFIPSPWNTLAGLVGFVGCVLAGVAVKPPAVVAGKPMLQGSALAIATAVMGLATQFYPLLPQGWPQGLALGVLGILAWFTGITQPTPLKGAPNPQLEMPLDTPINTKAKALDVLERGAKGPPES